MDAVGILASGQLSAGDGGSTSAEAQQFFDRLASLPDAGQQTAYAAVIDGLVSNGIWAKADAIYLFKAASSAAAYTNLKSSSYGITVSGNITFSVDAGVASGGGVLLTGFDPTAGGINFTRNSGTIAGRAQHSGQMAGPLIGSQLGTPGASTLYPRYTDDISYWRVNQTTNATQASTDASGLWTAVRTAGAVETLYRNGSSFDTDTIASDAPASQNLDMLYHGGEFYADLVTFGFIGSALSAGEVSTLNTLLDSYLAVVSPTAGSEATAFLARVAAQSAAYTEAYTTLINGLVADGIWAKADAIYVFKAASSATAYTNLKSSSYGITASGSITFTADVGVTSGGGLLDTGFNPSTASSPNYTQNSATVAARSETSTGIAGGLFGYAVADASDVSLYPRYTDNNTYYNLNSGFGAKASTNGSGTWVLTRAAAGLMSLYRNAALFDTAAVASAAVANKTIIFLKYTTEHYTGNVTFGFIGGALTAADAANLHVRLNTFMGSVP